MRSLFNQHNGQPHSAVVALGLYMGLVRHADAVEIVTTAQHSHSLRHLQTKPIWLDQKQHTMSTKDQSLMTGEGLVDVSVDPENLVAGTIDGLEAYEFPKQSVQACAGGFNLLVGDGTCLLQAIETNQVAETSSNATLLWPKCKPMNSEQLAEFDDLLRSVIFMIDCDLQQPHDPELYRQFFGRDTYRATKDWILGLVRQTLWDLLNRDQGSERAYNFRITKFHGCEHGGHDFTAKTLDSSDEFCDEMEFSTVLFDRLRSIDEFFLSRVELTPWGMEQAYTTREGVLLHEFMHLVSAWHEKELWSRTGMGHGEDTYPIIDLDLAELPNFEDVDKRLGISPEDRELLSSLGYGHLNCSLLAIIDPAAAVFNADNWVQYVVGRTYRYMNQVLRPDKDMLLRQYNDELISRMRQAIVTDNLEWSTSERQANSLRAFPSGVPTHLYPQLDRSVTNFYREKQEIVRRLMRVKPNCQVKPTTSVWYVDGHHEEFHRMVLARTGEKAWLESKTKLSRALQRAAKLKLFSED